MPQSPTRALGDRMVSSISVRTAGVGWEGTDGQRDGRTDRGVHIFLIGELQKLSSKGDLAI